MAAIELSRLTKSFGGTPLFEELDFSVEDGEFMVIVGPSGCGKSTLLRVIAGIEGTSGGQVHIGGRDVSNLHPGDRDIAMVFQDYALYPHMTVAQNLSFGLRARRVPRDIIAERTQQTAATLGIDGMLRRKPAQLSGGERQRVALGRAMIREPRAYLMDEPLSNLDAALRVQMRAELIGFHRRTRGTVLYVTHDQVEAMTMGQRIAVMRRGAFQQTGPPQEVYARPATSFVARFLGSPRMNLIEATVGRGEDGLVELRGGGLCWQVPERVLPGSLPERVEVGFRPEALRPPAGTAASAQVQGAAVLERKVSFVEHLGNEAIAHLEPRPGEGDGLVARVAPTLLEHPGRLARFEVALEAIHVFEPEADGEGRALWHGGEVTSHGRMEEVGNA